MDKKLTAIYCRVASADEYAIEAQKDYLCRYAGLSRRRCLD